MSDGVIAQNKKASFEYEIKERFEAGICLRGTEVKSIRAGKINLSEGWVEINDALEAFLHQVSISGYAFGNINNHKDTRVRKLLLKKRELAKLKDAISAKGFTLIPTRVYLKNRLVKVEVSLGKGKKLHDKRQSAKEKDDRLDIERALRSKNKS